MGRLALAWRILTNSEFAQTISRLLESPSSLTGPPDTSPQKPTASKPNSTSTALSRQASQSPIQSASPEPPRNSRSDALTLLAALQREGRLIDFLKEPIDSYTDAQVGAAVRDIHRDCSAVLERQFAIRPLREENEGASLSFSGPPDPALIRSLGEVSGGGARSGKLLHHGWTATRCELPQWSGLSETAQVLMPAEVEFRA